MTTPFEPEVAASLRELTRRLYDEIPELKDVLEEAKVEGVPEAEVMRRVMTVVMSDPSMASRIEAMAAETFSPLHTALTPAASTALDTERLQAEDIVIPPPFGVGLPKMHPNYEAGLLERLQFDGDAPELRFGPMPPGGSPAVPVNTTARNPVAIGWMLEKAREEVAAEMRQIEGARGAEVAGLLENEEPHALDVRGTSALEKLDKESLPDPAGYGRGQVPANREVEPPEGWALATLTHEQRGQLAWEFLSTTQGRRSATSVIQEMMWTKLRSDGQDVVLGEDTPGRVAPGDVLAHAEWTVDLSGPLATQSSFAFVDTAALVLVRKLEMQLSDGAGAGARLEVTPVNTVDVRKVGWAARLLRRVSS